MKRSIDAFFLTGQGPWGRLALSRGASELVSKRWMEGAVPLILAFLLSITLVQFTSVGFSDSSSILDEVAEKGLIAIGLTIVIAAGGLDLSVGAIVGVVSIGSQVALKAWELPVPLVVVFCLVLGAALGSVNGFFIAILNTRPFITTLVTLLTFRGAIKGLSGRYAIELASPFQDSSWEFLGDGRVAGIPLPWVIISLVLVASHIMLTRMRWGWWITSVGSDRRSARRNSVPIGGVVFSTYVVSGMLAGCAGLLTAARLGRSDPGVGEGWEVLVLTAVVLGGVSLSGGRASVARAVIGLVVVALIQQVAIAERLGSGWLSAILAIVLLVFALVDLKWGKYRPLMAEKLKLDPARVAIGPLIDVSDATSLWAINSKLTDAPPIGIGTIEGAEDCAIDNAGSIYCGDRRGWIWKFSDDQRGDVFARTGGLPLGHAWDQHGDLIVAVGGIGVQKVRSDGSTETVASQVKRSWTSLNDDSAIRFADDIDIAPDGAIYVSDFSTRTNAAEYMLEVVEYRPNGRVIRIDPDGSTEIVIRNYVFPNGICTSHDGQSILVASTGMYRVDRLWISGPKQGQLEPLLEDLPGYPDNINRASDGNYWMSFVAMRTAFSDLTINHPKIRRRMTKELPADDWIVPQLNVSCVIKFSDVGEVLSVMWDESLENYPMVTSINEFQGHLYLCGINNNRLGKLTLPADEVGTIDPRQVPTFTKFVPPFGIEDPVELARWNS